MMTYKKAILPLGFEANGVACGIKRSGKLDLALIYSRLAAKASCRFTTNAIKAAPLHLDNLYLKDNKEYRAILINSGNANCCNGDCGIPDALETNKSLAKYLGLGKESILLASTGVIGKRLPVAKIKKAMPELVGGLSRDNIAKAKAAILTTDKFTKEITVKLKIGKSIVTLCGIAKGAGMIAPNMATMLCFILTDARITQKALDKALTGAIENSFNCITVDGCMSTNDSVIVMANGAAQNSLIGGGSYLIQFRLALDMVCLWLAKAIIHDAEGATKFIQINVQGAGSFPEARSAALSIANSNLFKAAVYGENPNFGRIAAGLGSSGIKLREEDLKIKVSSLKKADIIVDVYLKRGDSSATVYTSDLTPEYIKINAEYN